MPEQNDERGLAVLAADDSVLMSDAVAERWLADLGTEEGDEPPAVIAAAVSQSRTGPARIHAQTASGVWLLICASKIAGEGNVRTALTLEPARLHDLAPLIADAYALTERERVVTQLVAEGLQTAAIALRLHISSWTVQDHLKSVFDKTGVSTRGELVARVFFAHDVPRLTIG